MAGLITVKVTIEGAVEFVSTSPIVDFAEVYAINNYPVSVTARIIGYSYNVEGTANQVRLVLTPPNATTGGEEDIPLEIRTGGANDPVLNSFSNLCGPEGIVVPRRTGIESTAQPPVGAVTDGSSYRLFFSTTDKDDDGTFYCWYKIEGLNEGD